MRVSKCLLYLVPLFSLFGCSKQIENEVIKPSNSVKISYTYDEVQEYELFWETMFDVNSENYYVYIYSNSCSHCEDLKDYIIEKALTRGDIYFVKGTSNDQIGNDPNKSKYAGNPGDIWILGYPSLLKITDKKCMKNLAGISQIKAELK